MDVRITEMFEWILLLKINNKFHGFGFFLLLCFLCLYNALHIVGAQMLEEDRERAGRREKFKQEGIL